MKNPRKALRFALPLLIAAVIAELAVLVFGFMYESAVTPRGVPSLFGVGAFGWILLSTESMKLPFAWFLAARSRRGKILGTVVVLLPLCVLTFELTKDAAQNEVSASLAPVAEAEREMGRLTANNTTLRSEIVAAEQNRDRARSIAEEKRQATSQAIMEIEARRDADVRRVSELIAAIDDVRDPLVDQRIAAIRDGAAARIATISSELAELAAARARRLEEHRAGAAAARDAWAAEREAWEMANQSAREAWQARVDEADRQFREEREAFEAERRRLEGQLVEQDEWLAAQVKMHKDNDRPFYNLTQKIAADTATADANKARIQDQITNLSPPVRREIKQPAHTAAPARPVEPNLDVSDLDARQADAQGRRERVETEVQTEIAALMAAADEAARQRRAKATARRTELVRQRDRVMKDADDRIRRLEADLDETLASLGAALFAPVQMAARVDASEREIAANEKRVAALAADSDEALRNTQIWRIAAFLGAMMPDRTDRERIGFAQSYVVPGLAFLAACLPALLIEVAASSLCPAPSRSIFAVRSLKSRLRSEQQEVIARARADAERRTAAASRDAEIARSKAAAADAAAGRALAENKSLQHTLAAQRERTLQVEVTAAQQVLNHQLASEAEIVIARGQQATAEGRAAAIERRHARLSTKFDRQRRRYRSAARFVHRL